MLINSYVSYALSVLGRSERTVTEYAKEIRAFAKWLAPDLEPSDALPLAVRSNVNAYLEHCLKNGNAASTRARKISALRMFYNYLVEQGVIDVNPIATMPRPSVPRPMPRFLNLDDCRLLIRTARARDDIFYRRRHQRPPKQLILAGVLLCDHDYRPRRNLGKGTLRNKSQVRSAQRLTTQTSPCHARCLVTHCWAQKVELPFI
jgi:integrase/recombinase XerC